MWLVCITTTVRERDVDEFIFEIVNIMDDVVYFPRDLPSSLDWVDERESFTFSNDMVKTLIYGRLETF